MPTPSGRDGSYASLGRAQIASIERTGSHESLTAHPLISPTSQNSHAVPVQRYLPYTPRQRTSSAFTSTSSTTASGNSVSAQHQGDATATSQLRTMNLKAAAQGLGVDIGSMGWAMLERLIASNDNAEWADIWTVLMSGQASLLLPLEPATSHEVITPKLVMDHLILSDTSSRVNAPIVTLSGLRGVLTNETLTFRASLPPSSKLFQALLSTSNASALSNLPPLPLSLPSLSFPSFTLPTHTPALPLPLRPPSKRQLSGRSNLRPSVSAAGSTASRIASPFVSFFGKPTMPVPPSTTNTPSIASNSSDPLSTPQNAVDSGEHVVEVPAFAISKRIVFKEVAMAIMDNIYASMTVDPPIPAWVLNEVVKFATTFFPFVTMDKAGKLGGAPGRNPRYLAINDLVVEGSDEVAEAFQHFYADLEKELRKGLQGERIGVPAPKALPIDVESEQRGVLKKIESNGDGDGESNGIIDMILESIESVICALFYDRLFRQPTSDDASHDDALSSRIAALNMLEIGLEHLDIDVGNVGTDLDLVVKACGETLMQLDSCLTPAHKARVLVLAHRVVVDGLSTLPPIQLVSRSDGEESSQSVRRPSPSGGDTDSPKTSFRRLADSEKELKLLPAAILHASETGVDMERTPTGPAFDNPSETERYSPGAIAPHGPPRPQPPVQSTEMQSPTPISGDILLPILIYAVVKANPPNLISHLLFTQRFRNSSLGGEESYCLINLMAVAEFLENIDLAALGLARENEQNVSLSPIVHSGSPLQTPLHLASSLRGRVDLLAGSANKVITGVVDTSFGVFRSLLPGAPETNNAQGEKQEPTNVPWNVPRPGFGLLRREAGFSIASIAASLPGGKGARNVSEESGQQLVTVSASSRPASVRSGYTGNEGYSDGESGGDANEGGVEDSGRRDASTGEGPDARSIRSFESMMKERGRKGVGMRKTISDRLAHLSQLGTAQHDSPKASSPDSRHSSLPPVHILRLAPPNLRFMDCSEDDIKVSEVGELLREYRRLVEGIREFGGFDA